MNDPTVIGPSPTTPSSSMRRSDVALIIATAALVLAVVTVLALTVGRNGMHGGSPVHGTGIGTMHSRMMDGPTGGWSMHFPRQSNEGGQR